MNADLSHVFKLGKGPKQVHVNCLTSPQNFDVPPVDNFVKSTRRVYECYFYHMIEMSDLPHV